MTLIEMLNIWNEATAPYKMRDEDEHARCKVIAQNTMSDIRDHYREGVDYRELSNGSLIAITH